MDVYDVAIIGGGINGCGCAADAALRGLKVFLCEKDDLASQTSSSSTKLIHGGLRYLELYDFGLVKKALEERQVLLEIAPHIVKPLPLVIPYIKKMRPRWLIRLGLFFYDHLSGNNKLPKSKSLSRKKNEACFHSLEEEFKKGFLYYDASTDDARLTIANALQAKQHHAKIATRTELIKTEARNNYWILTLKPKQGDTYQIKAKSIINASGPWMEQINQLMKIPIKHKLTLVKGSHLVVHKLYEGNHAYLLQHKDKRVVFIIPYHGFTLIGTTDVAFNKPLIDIAIDPEEVNYLCSIVNTYFHKKIKKNDIVYTYSGVRPLLAEDSRALKNISRDYAYHYTDAPAPTVTIYSGKITTYRQVAEKVINELGSVFPSLKKSCTHKVLLPGACYQNMELEEYKHYARQKYYWLDEETFNRYVTTYGSRLEELLAGKHSLEDLGVLFCPTLYQTEIDFLIREEWAITAEDILMRRTKLGLGLDFEVVKRLKEYINQTESRP
ncbi:glycerol-3-phosphate dehydrogenase (plasmid) [Legionella adelaidensis]|uniref:Glycerol-3-phosphate dehydrogenase n=1 Tax=Legionella adelaidensis TaxID=45056 RepID=A0A0W0R533_9GAMM|nr:glycerol-3-phosphate dehydrogenase [Legionella adelaidensis]KTC66130.1 glycerol-3-phosphate dehydrogenase [Legionella adelaidensis]VEH85642.1 glycerol-3-phosphate dehydrogenase [Legionella adelaidensis]